MLQNTTVGDGAFDSSVEMVTCMQDLPYDLIDDEWMDSVEYDHESKILRACKNTNKCCSNWASLGCCEKQEHKHLLYKECVPSYQVCHIARVLSEYNFFYYYFLKFKGGLWVYAFSV